MSSSFSSDEIERYSRHLLLSEIGGPGQQKIRQARVLMVGMGGLGCPVTQYLVAAGIGTLGLMDEDRVALSNLPRQILYTSTDIGRLKVECAQEKLALLNPHVLITPHPFRFGQDAARDRTLLKSYDLIMDGTDNFETRYQLADLCAEAHRPLITGAVRAFEGYVTTLRPFESSPEGMLYPTYRCLFPSPPADSSPLTSCRDVGILGPVTGLIGTLMGLEALRQIVSFGEGLVGRLLILNAFTLRFTLIHYTRLKGDTNDLAS